MCIRDSACFALLTYLRGLSPAPTGETEAVGSVMARSQPKHNHAVSHPIYQDSGHGDIICAGSGPVFDLVAQGEVGAGVAGVGRGEVFTQLGDRVGRAPGW